MSSNYVTSNGLVIPDYANIVSDLETDFKEVFGNTIDVSAQSTFGQIIAIFAKYISNNFLMAQEIYTNRNPKEAEGLSLDYIVSENAIVRLDATPTKITNAILYGDSGTLVLAGKRARASLQTVEYSLDANVTILNTNAVYAKVILSSVSVGTSYTVTLDSVPYTHTAIMGNTVNDVMNALKVLIDAGAWDGTATVNSSDELELSKNIAFTITVNNLTLDEVGTIGNFTCTENGANSIPANSLDTIVTSVTGWNRVLNPTAGITGRDTETDAELRVRREASIAGVGNATEEAIRTKIFDDVDGVTGVAVYSNRTNAIDGESRPPHSFEAVVEGGNYLDIAKKLWEIMPVGITSIGNLNNDGSINVSFPGAGVKVTDSQGYIQIIGFSRPKPIYIWVRVKRDLYNEEVYPDNGDDLIKDAIVEWASNRSNIDVGKDVIRQRLSIPVYTIPGISDILIELDSSLSLTHSPSYSETNITVSDRQLASFAIGRIVVADLT